MKTQIKSILFSGKVLTITVLLLLISVGLSYSQSGWFTVYTDTSGGFECCTFTNTNTGYAIGSEFINSMQYPKVIRTTNAGNDWDDIKTPLSDSVDVVFRCVTFADANTGFITAANYTNLNYGRILRTTNGGNNWSIVYLPLDKHMTRIFFVNSLTGYATGYQTIFKTTDAGINWALSYQVGGGYFLFGIHFEDVNTGYMVGNGGIIRKTTDGGNSWTYQNSHYSTSLWSVWFTDVNTGFAVGGHSSNIGNVILRTTNGGTNWDSISHPPSVAFLYSVRFISPTTGYITGNWSQILKTTNGGLNWYYQILPVPVSINFFTCSSFFTNENTGYIVGQPWLGDIYYIFKTTNGGITFSGNITTDIPERYNLFQNYPNPFNSMTSIKFQVPMDSRLRGNDNVVLKVFDLLGKEVATLINEKRQPGFYEVTFEAGDLPSGIYFYKLTAGEFTDTKRMVLIK